jgi:hypothetical protein
VKILIYGAGPLGSLFAARLIEAGQVVYLCVSPTDVVSFPPALGGIADPCGHLIGPCTGSPPVVKMIISTVESSVCLLPCKLFGCNLRNRLIYQDQQSDGLSLEDLWSGCQYR